VTEDGLAQLAAWQLVPREWNAHFPPEQVPVGPHRSVGFAMQIPCGSGDLSATVVQWPGAVARLQAMQAPWHALSQHVPWAQKVDRHSVPSLHSAPLGFRPQEALVQKFPVTHWLLLLVQVL